MEELLVHEMTSEVVTNRPHRAAVYRPARPASETEQARPLPDVRVMADEPPHDAFIVTQTARPSLQFSTPSASEMLSGLQTGAAKRPLLKRERVTGSFVTGALSQLHLCRQRRPLARVAPRHDSS